MITKAVRHIGIFTNKINDMIEFYTNILGLKVVYDNIEEIQDMLGLSHGIMVRVIKMATEDGSQVELLDDIDNQMIPLLPQGRRYFGHGLSHIALSVKDLDSIYNKLVEHGNFVYTDSVYDAGLVRVLFCEDFDGNTLELVEEL
jgi:catechol 2,3-dioxygenase-like lactoylglutathione lyase family enzyme